ncbi:BlaI/MecI/CopY family transcriptional regulator [Streptomyces sp. NPDC007904]|uniref:BlaI/MecI/CopY family transcriptional regulator n=1 Tax=Streptomyces sp. NPDC007904 TaxID=3364787 RepID=UPI0036EE2BF3
MATAPEEPATQSLQSQYAEQFANHLAANREEQARLRRRLEQLVTDEAWLVRALKTVSVPEENETDAAAQVPDDESAQPQDSTSGSVEPTKAPGPAVEASAAVPQQRQDKPAEAPAKQTGAKKTTARKSAGRKPTAAKKPTAKKTAAEQGPAAKKAPMAKRAAARDGEPSLGELLLAVLDKHAGQPRTASEVVGDLKREYPERARDVNTVRNTLERLVAKSRVERTKQKNTVLYTVVAESAPAAGDTFTAGDASPAAQTAGAEETARVPAQA